MGMASTLSLEHLLDRSEVLDQMVVIPAEADREVPMVSLAGENSGHKEEKQAKATGRPLLLEGTVAAWIEAIGKVADLEAALDRTTVDSPWRERLETLLAARRRRLLVLEIERKRLNAVR